MVTAARRCPHFVCPTYTEETLDWGWLVVQKVEKTEESHDYFHLAGKQPFYHNSQCLHFKYPYTPSKTEMVKDENLGASELEHMGVIHTSIATFSVLVQ